MHDLYPQVKVKTQSSMNSDSDLKELHTYDFYYGVQPSSQRCSKVREPFFKEKKTSSPFVVT